MFTNADEVRFNTYKNRVRRKILSEVDDQIKDASKVGKFSAIVEFEIKNANDEIELEAVEWMLKYKGYEVERDIIDGDIMNNRSTLEISWRREI